MKRLSSELLKNYFIIVVLFASGYLGINFFLKQYLIQQSINDIKQAKFFLQEELKEMEHQNIEYFYWNAVMESPKANQLFINIFFDGDSFVEKNSPILYELDSQGEILKKSENYVLNTRMSLLNGETIGVQIIRGTSKENKFLKKIFRISFLGLLLIIFVSYRIHRYFYKKILTQFEQIEKATSLINLDHFNVNFDKSAFFQEFSSIFAAYEKMLERLEEQTTSQIEFVQNASHELRTPISVISGYVNLIDRWGIDDKNILREALCSIKDETKNIAALIEKLLFLAKRGELKLDYEEFNVSELVDEINSEMNILYPKAKLASKGDSTLILNSDRSLLKQLLRNLIKNGIMYSNQGSVKTCYYISDSELILKVKDNGIGIDEKELEKIFEKFYRVDKSRARDLGGHGLGLSIVKTILEILGGKIKIESKPKNGTTVFLIFNVK